MINDILVIMALKKEGGENLEKLGARVVYCGLGKVNAAMVLAEEIMKNPPKLIVNLGTAGSSLFKKGELVACHQFIQRDMDVSPLGYKPFETPFDEVPILIEHPKTFHHLKHGICGTGDSFDTSHDGSKGELVDMEGYALAKVAKKHNIPFACAKYISDGADDRADEDWYEGLKSSPERFEQLFVQSFVK